MGGFRLKSIRIALFACLMAVSFAFSGHEISVKMKIVSKISEVSNSGLAYNSYMCKYEKGPNKGKSFVFVIYNLDKPDMQKLDADLNNAFENKMKIIRYRNPHRTEKELSWVLPNGSNGRVNFVDRIYSGQTAYIMFQR